MMQTVTIAKRQKTNRTDAVARPICSNDKKKFLLYQHRKRHRQNVKIELLRNLVRTVISLHK